MSSGLDTVYVHTLLIRRASKLISSLLGEPCTCQANASIVLPSSPPSTLESLVRLLYTGLVSNLSEDHAKQVCVLAKQIGIDLSIEEVEGLTTTQNEKLDNGHNDNRNNTIDGQKTELGSTLLNIQTLVRNDKIGSTVRLCFPSSRIKRQTSENQTVEMLSGFKGRVQREYNEHSVGQYMGPYDQNENLKLNIQLPN